MTGPGNITAFAAHLSIGCNDYTGVTNIGTPAATGGILRLDNANALGRVTAITVVNNGSTLLLNASTSLENLTLNGTGYVNNNLAGALLTNTGVTFGGFITSNPGATIGTQGGNLTLSGMVIGDSDLVKVGANTLILQAGNSYRGNTYIDQARRHVQQQRHRVLHRHSARHGRLHC